MEQLYHKPVLLDESIKGLAIRSDGVYVDATYGGGGHSKAILDKLSSKGKLYAFDQDEYSQKNMIDDYRFKFIDSNFKFLNKFLKHHDIEEVDGILADFGVSSYQLNNPERGFSYRFNGPLDMRMNKFQKFSASDIINKYSKEELSNLFKDYGELRNYKQLAAVIGVRRSIAPINTTEQLRNSVTSIISDRFLNKTLSKIFQALRIEVNQELECIKEFLIQSSRALVPGGRLVCISYHSLEDRLVKRFILNGKFNEEPIKDFYGNKNVPLKKIGGVKTPMINEIENNIRSRSAKLRIAQKIKN
ncbi:MAG: 16S rRNA (cytosine(1402)-N(4))-methyltransferase [Flavobacteriaceae bacterium]|nr:16S rRNA (cytosine(1402)-N(4))-methyltransferase [Flavobacteriaceae bacterium]|tara:strand:- start:13514 stop:14422 length:909 start_codon:yes stop_codon:yes gene_type:complete